MQTNIMTMKKVRNFQEEFSLQDMEIAREVKETYDCGMSRIALKAPDQIERCGERIFKEPDSQYATVICKTLKMQYAIQVWCKAVLISEANPGDLLYYWWLNWADGDGPFRKIEYSKFYNDITVEQLLAQFWKLLEDVANSGEISVNEGFWISSEAIKYKKEPDIVCEVVLDKKCARDIKVDDVYHYNYNRKPVSYKWKEIKEFFCELTLDQLRLTMPKQLHKHTKIDDILLQACEDWDISAIKSAISKGADVNCLGQMGYSPLQRVVESCRYHGINGGMNLTEEETVAIEKRNYLVCREIVDVLLEFGADIDLFGYDGMQPLACAYYEKSVEMIKHLLAKGANPNYNSYLTDKQYWPLLKSVRCTILDVISEDLEEEYDDTEKEIEKIIRDAGGREYVWDFDPWNYENIGKYVVAIRPSKEGDGLFIDNAGWDIGTPESLTIEDEADNQTIINLTSVTGLKEWLKEFQDNFKNVGYDWKAWKKRGYNLALEVAAILPDRVALFYLHDNENVIKEYSSGWWGLCRDGDIIRIK